MSISKLGLFIVLFIFALVMVFPFNLLIISPYEDTTKTIDLFFITAFACLFLTTLLLFDSEKHKTVLRNICVLLISAVIVSFFMFALKSSVIQFITNINYFDIKYTANNHEKIKTTQPYKDFELAYSVKDTEYLHKYFKDNGIDNFSEINDKDKYDLITYVKVLNDPIVNQEFKKIYDDSVITRKEYKDFQKFTIENAKDIK